MRVQFGQVSHFSLRRPFNQIDQDLICIEILRSKTGDNVAEVRALEFRMFVKPSCEESLA